MLRCPYITDGWTSDSTKPINEQMADLFQHLADVHHPNDPENSLLEELAGKMRGASIPFWSVLGSLGGAFDGLLAEASTTATKLETQIENLTFKVEELTRTVEKRIG